MQESKLSHRVDGFVFATRVRDLNNRGGPSDPQHCKRIKSLSQAGAVTPFVANVGWKHTTSKDEARLHQFGQKCWMVFLRIIPLRSTLKDSSSLLFSVCRGNAEVIPTLSDCSRLLRATYSVKTRQTNRGRNVEEGKRAYWTMSGGFISAITQYPDHHFLCEIFTIPRKHIVTRPTSRARSSTRSSTR